MPSDAPEQGLSPEKLKHLRLSCNENDNLAGLLPNLYNTIEHEAEVGYSDLLNQYLNFCLIKNLDLDAQTRESILQSYPWKKQTRQSLFVLP